MKKPFLKYVGDQKIRDLLEHYACPVPFHAVRTRFLGNIATLRLDASPVEAVKGFWGGELPEFNSLDDVNALLQDLMSLWNALAIHQSRSKPFRLSRGTTGSNSNDLQRFCRTRTAWLTDVLARIADHKITRLSELMPWGYTRQSRV